MRFLNLAFHLPNTWAVPSTIRVTNITNQGICSTTRPALRWPTVSSKPKQIEKSHLQLEFTNGNNNRNSNNNNNNNKNNNNDNNGDDSEHNRDFQDSYLLLTSLAAVVFVKSNPLPPPSAFVSPANVAATSTPLVIILSWMGANPKNLKAYVNHYQKKGYEVQIFLNDFTTALFPPSTKAQAMKIVRVLEQVPEGKPVIIHAFSIGTGVYGFVLDHLQKTEDACRKSIGSGSDKALKVIKKIRANIAGVVFDSGPAAIYAKDVARGLHTVCPAISKAFWAGLANAFFVVTQARQNFEKSEAALRNFQFKAPQLYFYSMDDNVISRAHEAISAFIDNNKKKGMEVYHKAWDRSVHATHIRIHPEEYIENLDKFLHRCMENFEHAKVTAKENFEHAKVAAKENFEHAKENFFHESHPSKAVAQN